MECLRPLKKKRRARKKVFVTGAISQRAFQELCKTSQVFSHLLAEMPDFLPQDFVALVYDLILAQSMNTYLFRTYYVPGTMLGSEVRFKEDSSILYFGSRKYIFPSHFD